MDIAEIVQRLVDNGYPVTLIAKQSGVPYMVIYNHWKGRTCNISERHIKRLERFAFRQPCFDGVEL